MRQEIEWLCDDSHILVNPSYTLEEQARLRSLLGSAASLPAHIWVATSGSTSAKWVGLSKKAILSSAAAVNEHLQCCSSDVWIHALPDFHVGGLGIRARAFLSGNRIIDFKEAVNFKWDPEAFSQCAHVSRATLTSLVPAQLYDLVRLRLQSPPLLRAVIIGGGQLPEALYFQALKLGWKVLPSYGMTECSSQVATAELSCWENRTLPPLRLLPHLEVRVAHDQRLCIKGSSLLTAYALREGSSWRIQDPKLEGWFTSEDRGELSAGYLQVYGRMDHTIKVGGESVDMLYLENLLQEIRVSMNYPDDMALIDLTDERLGCSVHLVVAGPGPVQEVVDRFHQRVLPFERIRRVHQVAAIPRSSLMKLLKNELRELLS